MTRSARAYRDDYEPPPEGTTGLPLFQTEGEAARDQVLQAFEENRPQVVAALRAEAWRLWQLHRRALSANDIRPVLERFPGTDPRILVTAFRGWRVVGETRANGPKNHARRIFTYVPLVTE